MLLSDFITSLALWVLTMQGLSLVISIQQEHDFWICLRARKITLVCLTQSFSSTFVVEVDQHCAPFYIYLVLV